jgi:beta-glucanase (GH16 family)
MEKFILFLFLLSLIFSTSTVTSAQSDYVLVWSDEFDGPAGSRPDPAKWQYNTGGTGWGNEEWEFYTDHPENAWLRGNGTLAITARKNADRSYYDLECWYGRCRYTSARITTQDLYEFTYGKVEARIKLPFGQGIWPAFWLLGYNIDDVGWPQCGEIDIMEHLGKRPTMVHGNVHGPGYSGVGGIDDYKLPQDQLFRDDFHIFAVEWDEKEMRWYVDGEQYGRVTKEKHFNASNPWVFDHPFFIILNVAVGGEWPGYPDKTTTFPQMMIVDYVRVYQRP